MNKLNALHAARLYHLARGRPGSTAGEDISALTSLMSEFAMAGARTAFEAAKRIYQDKHPGNCRMYSQGEACQCFLCLMDDMILHMAGKE